MKVKRIYWRRDFFSQLRRNYGAINSTDIIWTKNVKKDHALEWGPRNDNPGIWKGITDRIGSKDNPTVIQIENSHNDIELWIPDNEARGNKPKINQQIWKDDKQTIDVWFYHNFKLTLEILEEYQKEKGKFTQEESTFYTFIKDKLELLPNVKSVDYNILRNWVSECISDMNRLHLDMSWFADKNFSDIGKLVFQSILMIVQCEDEVDNKVKYYVSAAKISSLPVEISNEILDKDTEGCIDLSYDESEENIKEEEIDDDVMMIIDSLKIHKNVILYGPPGTGKSYLMNKVSKLFNYGNKNTLNFNINNIEQPFENRMITENLQSRWCTFHQSYSYNNFVVGIKPYIVNTDDGKSIVAYKSEKGPFLELALQSSPYIWKRDLNDNLVKIENFNHKDSLLLIDEINRANTAEVFGDLITVIEPTKRLDCHGNIAPETIPITLNNEYEYNGHKNLVDFYMPSNMYLLASMNSLDKSVAPLDAAFKRRFRIINIAPNYKVLLKHYGLSEATIESSVEMNDKNYYKIFAYRLFKKINKFIFETRGEEYLLGQAYYWELGEENIDLKKTLVNIIKYKIYPQLRELYASNNEQIIELFSEKNDGVLYEKYEGEFDDFIHIINIENISDETILKAFSFIANIDYEVENDMKVNYSFNSYQDMIVKSIIEKIKINKNCILYGPPGTGKSYICNQIKDYFLNNDGVYRWITFHPSMSYEKFIIGMMPELINNNINYQVKNGVVLDLNIKNKEKDKLLIIDEINRGNTSEIFGELITLFEKDKREKYKIQLPYQFNDNGTKTKEFSLDNNFYTIGTMNSIDKSVSPLDSALRRRFYIININTDYRLLELYFETSDIVLGDEINNKKDELKLAILLLKAINDKISRYRGEDYQIGHAYIWRLKEYENPLDELCNIFDENIMPYLIEMFGKNNELIIDILGENSPIIKNIDEKIIITEVKKLAIEDKILTFRGIIQ